jgi:Protein of unknown function (DUF3800)
MYVCYIDESGDTSPLKDDKAQPAFIINGIIVPQARIYRITQDFLSLKQAFNPKALPSTSPRLDWIRQEVKGSDLRKEAVSPSHRKQRYAIGFFDKVLDLLEKHDTCLVGRVFVKEPGIHVNHASIYNHSLQYICSHFEHYLDLKQSPGIAVIDSRSPAQNIIASHSIFTQKHKAGSDAYPHLMEVPSFGHSDNHAGLQLADLICSAFLWPMAMHAYCEGHITSIHIVNGYWQIGARYGTRIKRMQHRYQLANGHWDGGISVSDRLGRQSGSLLFKAAPPPAP